MLSICPSLVMWTLTFWSKCCLVTYYTVRLLFSPLVTNNWSVGDTLWYANILLLIQVHPTPKFGSINDACPNQSLLCWSLSADFPVPLLSQHVWVGILFPWRALCPFLPPSPPSVPPLPSAAAVSSVLSRRFLFYLVGDNVSLSFILMLKLS